MPISQKEKFANCWKYETSFKKPRNLILQLLTKIYVKLQLPLLSEVV